MKLQLGSSLTKGLGSGGDPDVGRNATLEDASRLAEELKGADMVFITAGMGGGTGTGGAPVVAQVARDAGALTVGVVTRPFFFEGRKRVRQADEGIAVLSQAVDALITIPNDKLLSLAGQSLPMLEAFQRADDVLLNAVKGISDLITSTGHINVDFADVRTVMGNTGLALMGTGRASGERRAYEAMQQAISSPLLDDISIDGARGILINITSSANLTMRELSEATGLIHDCAHEDANIIIGSVINESLEGEVEVTVIATGFGKRAEAQVEPARGSVIQMSQMAMPYGNPPAEVPAYVRTRRNLETGEARSGSVMSSFGESKDALGVMEESEIDIPTFLRRQGGLD
jgi:cell division protein FtsZ